MTPLRLTVPLALVVLVASAAVAAAALPGVASVAGVVAAAAIALALLVLLPRRRGSRGANRSAADLPPGDDEREDAPPSASGGATRLSPAAAALIGLLDTLAEGVFLLSSDLTVLAANEAAARITGTPTVEMRGRTLIRATMDHELVRAAREASGQSREVERADGHVLRIVAAPIAAGRVSTILVVEDRAELSRAQRARTDLVANVSHELRTPLAAARALAETLESGVEDSQARARFGHRLVVELDRLEGIVGGLLRLARIESGSEQFAIERLEPAALLATAAARIAPLADGQGVRVQVDGGVGATATVAGDRARVLEVLANLLDNAVRHSPPDGVVTLLAAADEHAPWELVRFEVRDQGPGILPSERSRVFERFYTPDRARSAEGGTGLGLAIARHLVERQHGRIWVADRTPGATLCFTLPRAAISVAEEPVDDPAPASSS